MFKLAQGEYVSPERVEMIYAQSHLVNQIFLDGNSRESFAIAICVPNMKSLREAMYLNKNGSLANGLVNGAPKKAKECEISDEELCAKKEACLTVLKDLVRLGKEAGLKGFEQARTLNIPRYNSCPHFLPLFARKFSILGKVYLPYAARVYSRVWSDDTDSKKASHRLPSNFQRRNKPALSGGDDFVN